MAPWVPKTWNGLGHMSGLVILGCRVWENDLKTQVNVIYHVAPMRFLEPMEPAIVAFVLENAPPLVADFKYKEFPAQRVELIVTNEYREQIDEKREKMMAQQIWDIWAYLSGYSQWQHELKVAEHERMHYWYGVDNWR